MNKRLYSNVKRSILGNLLIAVMLAVPMVGYAQADPLVGIPGVSGGSMSELINALYLVAISVAALLAVVKIVVAGAKYMLSDVVTNKQDAIKDIRGALLGLLIVLAAFLILSTINPQLLELEPLEDIDQVSVEERVPSTPSRSVPPPQRVKSCFATRAASTFDCSTQVASCQGVYRRIVCYDQGGTRSDCTDTRSSEVHCSEPIAVP